MKGRNQHVMPHGDKWAVRAEGSSRVTGTFATQRQAIDRARQIARNQRSELLVHGQNGRIRARDSLGNDPFPPRDKKH